MKIRLTRDEFLRQLNFDRGGDLPEIIYFDGIACNPEEQKKDYEEIWNDYPEIAKLLSKMECRIVNHLYVNIGNPVRREELYKFLNPGRNWVGNTVACHFNNIRKKLHKSKDLPLYFDTIRVQYFRGCPVLYKKDNETRS